MSLLQTINLRLVRRNRSMKWKRCAYRISLQTESVDFVCTAIKYSVTVRTPSGAEKQKWVDTGEVKAAVYKKNDMKVATSATYLESTHIGLTRCKSIKAEGYRLVKDDVVYRIIDCNPQGRMTNLLLKVVE